MCSILFKIDIPGMVMQTNCETLQQYFFIEKKKIENTI